MKEFTKEQPLDGDVVLSCEHYLGETLHWWKFPHEVYFRRPDNTVGTACWLVCCDKCKNNSKGDVKNIEIKTDFVWNGNEPAIWKET